MDSATLETAVAKTWNTSYPDRTPWEKLEPDAKAEWLRVFNIYESIILDIAITRL